MNTNIVDELDQVQLALAGTLRAELLSVDSDGTLMVRCDRGNVFRCDILESAFAATSVPTPGDRLIVMPPTASALGCVLGRVGRFRPSKVATHQTIEASEVLTLKCGEASIDLRADGKVMVRGEDVLLRAKGTQRIRAGTVSIN